MPREIIDSIVETIFDPEKKALIMEHLKTGVILNKGIFVKKSVVFTFLTGIYLLLSTPAEAAFDDHVRIRIEGENFVTSELADPPNQVFVPVGMGFSVETRVSRFIHASRFAKKNMLNTVRFNFRATNYKSNNSEHNFDSVLTDIQTWLDIARENRIYTILNNVEYLGHRSICLASYGTPAIDFWKGNMRKLADAVKDNPWVLGIEPMNEVFTHVLTREQVDSLLREAALSIREVNTRCVLFFNHHQINDPAYFDTLDPPQVSIAPHRYPSGDTTGWEMPIVWDQARTTGNHPALCTEFSGGYQGNGYTYAHNKTWLSGFLEAARHYDIGWLVFTYRSGYQNNNASSDPTDFYDWFPTLYAPDDPEVWRPAAIIVSENYPVPNNGTPVRIGFDSIPEWFSGFMATDDKVQLVLRVVDTTGSMVTGSNIPVSLNVSGPGTLLNVPASFTNGRATVTLRSGATPGAITVNASSGSLSGAYPLTSAKTWTGFQARMEDESWVDSGVAVDHYAPLCRVSIHHPSKGINLRSARYEYSTDGGASWVYWDDEESDEFEGTSLNTDKWTFLNHNTAGGSATVSNGSLAIQAEGEDIWSEWDLKWSMPNTYGKDEFSYVYEERTGEFEIVTKITSQDNTGPRALAGIMVRDNMEDTQYKGYCYVAATPDSGYVFAWKDLGHMINGGNKDDFKYIDARVFSGSVTYPCYLKLSKVMHPAYYDGTATGYNRRFHIYTAWYSTDGVNWTKIKSRYVHQAGQTQLAGLFACSGVSGAYGTAVFDFYRVGLRAIHTDASATDMYSSGVEQFQTKAIPFVDSDMRQEVRFRINTVPPFTDYMNNPGEELISPRYAVLDGEHTSVRPVTVVPEPADMRIVASEGAVLVNYTLSHDRVTGVRFSVYDVSGRMVWSRSLSSPGRQGSVVWQGTSGRGIPAGAYVVRMEETGADASRTVQAMVTQPGR